MGVLAVGTVALDLVETPTESKSALLGGSATYATLSARYMTDSVALVGVVGDDFPDKYISLLRRQGIDLSGLDLRKDGKTFAWGGRYGVDPNQRETLYTHLNVLATFEPVVPEEFRACDVLCLGNLHPKIQHSVLDQASNARFVVCDTMNYWIEHTPDSLARLLPRVDCLIINDEEVRQLANEPGLIAAARMVHSMGPRSLVVKKGEHGSMLFTGDHVFAVPAFPVEVVRDPTGAGDVFLGGFAGSLVGAKSITTDVLRRAVVFGSVLASVVVESFGPGGLIDLPVQRIAKRLRKLQAMTELPAQLSFPIDERSCDMEGENPSPRQDSQSEEVFT